MERRNTKQRQLILNIIKNRCDHPTAEQIYSEVHMHNPSVSKGTVYRNLAVLEENNQINHHDLTDAIHYDGTTEKHCHFICSVCKKVFDIDIDYDPDLDNRNVNGFQINSHETYFRGLCPDCIKEVKK